MTHKNLPQLSQTTVDELKTLRACSKGEFLALVKSLTNAEWPLRAIATPLKVSRTSVLNWVNSYDEAYPLPEVEKLPVVEPRDRTSGAKKKSLTQAQIDQLKELTESASHVRRYTDENAKSRKDAAILETLLLQYTQNGFTRTQLAEACEVSRSSIAQRLRKYL